MPQQLISLSGQTLAAITANEHVRGTPLVFIHGITSSVDLWEPSLPESIRHGRRWISLSLPGHHPSQIDPATFGSWDAVTPAAWAAWYEQALFQLVGDEPVDVVGWSTGGFSGLTLAAHYPRRVRSLMCISGFVSGNWRRMLGFYQRLCSSPLTRWGVRIGIRAVGRKRWLFDRLMAHAIGDHSAFQNSPLREQTMQDWFHAFGNHDPAMMTMLFQAIASLNVSDRLDQIQCPTLICGGEADPFIPASLTHWIAGHVPNSELEFWPGGGHLFFAERTQDYQELLVRWLERQKTTNHDC